MGPGQGHTPGSSHIASAAERNSQSEECVSGCEMRVHWRRIFGARVHAERARPKVPGSSRSAPGRRGRLRSGAPACRSRKRKKAARSTWRRKLRNEQRSGGVKPRSASRRLLHPLCCAPPPSFIAAVRRSRKMADRGRAGPRRLDMRRPNTLYPTGPLCRAPLHPRAGGVVDRIRDRRRRAVEPASGSSSGMSGQTHYLNLMMWDVNAETP